MASHMSCIGIPMNSEDDFRVFLEKLFDKGTKIKTRNGTYLKWEIGDGVELWGQLDSKNMAIGMNPHFSGSSNMKVLLSNRVQRETATKLDGAFYAWANPEKEEDGSGEFPFVFDLPNLDIYDSIKIPQIIDVQLAAFAHEIQIYESEEDFDKSQKGELKFAAKSFIPSGLFSPNGEDTLPPRAEAIFTGIIEEFKRIVNQDTGCEFYWMKVNTLGGDIDVVVDPEMLNGNLEVNGIVQGAFWISGKIVTEPVTINKSIWGKLFGR